MMRAYWTVCVLSSGRGGLGVYVFFFKQKTAYEMRISDWSSDVCSSDLQPLCFIVIPPRRRPSESGAALHRHRVFSSRVVSPAGIYRHQWVRTDRKSVV